MVEKTKSIFLKLKPVGKGFLWFFLTLLLGFLLQIIIVFLIQKTLGNSFSFYKIILDGNILLFIIAITSSLCVDTYILGKNNNYKKTVFFKMMYSVIPIIIICISAVLFSARYNKKIDEINNEFFLAAEITIFFITMIYAIIIKYNDFK